QMNKVRVGGRAPPALQKRVDEDIATHRASHAATPPGRECIVGNEFTGADVQITFVAEMATLLGPIGPYSNLRSHLPRMHARPAYRRAIERGGPSMMDV